MTVRPARLYAALARAEMVTWTLLILGMALKYGAGLDAATRVAGGVHGLVFLTYALVTVLVAVDHRWSVRDLALGVVSAVVPYATVPFERSVERRGLLDGDWRLRTGAPRTPADRVVAFALVRPLAAAVAGLVAVAVVFAVLLRLGPPTQWFG